MPVAEGHYLCGCNIEAKRGYRHELDTEGNSVTARTDKLGYDICPEHGMRQYGWRSHPIKQNPVKLKFAPSEMPDLRPQTLTGGMTAEEVGRDILENGASDLRPHRGSDVPMADQSDGVSP